MKWKGSIKESANVWYLFIGGIIVLIFILLSSCVTIFPKAPYPYSYHEENKTCDYWRYHRHYQGEKKGMTFSFSQGKVILKETRNIK